METLNRLELRQEFDKKTEWQRLTELQNERQVVNEKIAAMRQEIVSLSRKANKLGEEYHRELCRVKPSVVGPQPGEREKQRKEKSASEQILKALAGAMKKDSRTADKLAGLLDL